MESKVILNRIKAGISEIDPEAEVYLYGSRARGDHRADSDWDILVITPRKKVTLDYETELRDPIYNIELESGQIISLLVYSEQYWKTRMPYSPLFSNIKKEGLRIQRMKDENIAYRIKRARETYRDAEVLYEMGSINQSINRLYYAAFYATLALLLDKNIEVKSHKGVKQKLGEEFVLKGLISKDLAKIYSILSDYRHKGDYDDLFEFDQEIVENLFDPVKEYIDKIESLLSP